MASDLIVLLGPPGAGKSLQSKQLAEKHGWQRVSTGELLRASSDAKVQDFLRAGMLAPSELVQDVLAPRLAEIRPEQAIILDGFPRMLDEAHWLKQNLSGRDLRQVIYLKIDLELSRTRLQQRSRADDTPTAIDKRWQEYQESTEPVLAFYRQLHLLDEVDGSGTPEQVAKHLEEVVESHS